MRIQIENFKKLHHLEKPLLIGNIWDVQSALIFQKLGYKAIGTSSAAIANSLGYEDGQNIPFNEYLFVVKRISESTTLPLTVDLEAGYGSDVKVIFENISKLSQLGVVGINLEDSIMVDGIRRIEDLTKFSFKLEQLVQMLNKSKIEIFINVRCDVFLLGLDNALVETIERVKVYESKSVNGIFLPGITNEKDIASIVESTSLPVNVMCMPDLPDFDKLRELGVKRISMGNFANAFLYQKLEEAATSFISNNNFSILF